MSNLREGASSQRPRLEGQQQRASNCLMRAFDAASRASSCRAERPLYAGLVARCGVPLVIVVVISPFVDGYLSVGDGGPSSLPMRHRAGDGPGGDLEIMRVPG